MIYYILQGWPRNKRDTIDHLKPYYDNRNEFSLDNGIIMKGDRIYIP